MLERAILKQKARNVLGNNIFSSKWLMSALSNFIQMLVTQAVVTVFVVPTMLFLFIFTGSILIVSENIAAFIISYLILYPLFLVVFILTSVFILGPLQVGLIRYYLANRDPYDMDNPRMSLLFSAFKKGQYMNIVKIYGKTLLIVFLWMLIPVVGFVFGAIKSYEYMFALYLAADNPNINSKEALQKSSRMTDGQKGKLFVMHLSFLGWALIGAFACGIGTYFVMAYENAAFAEAYDDIKKYSISRGIITPADIGFDLNGDPNDPFWQPLDLNNPYIRNRNYSRGVNKYS